MSAPGPDPRAVARAVAAALEEDLGGTGDITTDAIIPEGSRGRARILARQRLVVAGLPVARHVFRVLDGSLSFRSRRSEGDDVVNGDVLAEIEGASRPILRGERTALNFLMRMCGIATVARAAVAEVAGTGAVVLDTRKTAPGLRALDKYAVAVGGAANHRMGLYDAAMIKDTHLAAAGSIGEAVARLRGAGVPADRITVEVRDGSQLEQAIAAGAGRALLDNMDLEGLRQSVALAGGRIALEASGGLRPGRLRPAAETGVDFLSIGALTHSAPAADVSMVLESLP